MRKILLATICMAIIANISCKKGKTTTTTTPIIKKDYSLLGKYSFIDSITFTKNNTQKTETGFVTLSLDTQSNFFDKYRNIILDNIVLHDCNFIPFSTTYRFNYDNSIEYGGSAHFSSCIDYGINNNYDTTLGIIKITYMQRDYFDIYKNVFHKVIYQKIY